MDRPIIFSSILLSKLITKVNFNNIVTGVSRNFCRKWEKSEIFARGLRWVPKTKRKLLEVSLKFHCSSAYENDYVFLTSLDKNKIVEEFIAFTAAMSKLQDEGQMLFCLRSPVDVIICGAWWLIGRFVAFRVVGSDPALAAP